MKTDMPALYNGQSLPLGDLPRFEGDAFADTLAGLLEPGGRVVAYFGDRQDRAGQTTLYAIVANDAAGKLYPLAGTVSSGRFPSVTPAFPQVHLFEREIHEQTGLVPEGHPWLKPVRFPLHTGEMLPAPVAGDMAFFKVDGEEIHEVAVGPVHAGIIEPGHFRFQCHGETVHHLEISLGYQHRGIEAALQGGPFVATPFQMEVVAGDTTAGHMIAYCKIIESLSGASQGARLQPTPYSDFARCIALELERCANHTGDLGALAGDIGYLPVQSYCGRLRGDFLNMTALLCGNRFGRGCIVPGGVGIALDEARLADLVGRLEGALADLSSCAGLLFEESSVLARFHRTGTLTREMAERIGLVGPAARACGCVRDIRQDHASGRYRFAQIPVSTLETGDVFARAFVRWRELLASGDFLLAELTQPPRAETPSGGSERTTPGLDADTIAVSLVEGWRGEICHVALTDGEGRFRRYKIIDPSFHNWFGLALAMRGQEISDFPLCNKSFNLSYCGFDL